MKRTIALLALLFSVGFTAAQRPNPNVPRASTSSKSS